MERLDKIKLAIEKGITCDPVTGKVYGVKGKELKSKVDGYNKIVMTKDYKGFHLLSHQFIYYIATGKIVDCIDHINGIKDDNRIENLREVTIQQNTFNTTSKGCNWHISRNKWRAQIHKNGKNIHLGYFNTEEEAHQSYLDAKKIYHNI